MGRGVDDVDDEGTSVAFGAESQLVWSCTKIVQRNTARLVGGGCALQPRVETPFHQPFPFVVLGVSEGTGEGEGGVAQVAVGRVVIEIAEIVVFVAVAQADVGVALLTVGRGDGVLLVEVVDSLLLRSQAWDGDSLDEFTVAVGDEQAVRLVGFRLRVVSPGTEVVAEVASHLGLGHGRTAEGTDPPDDGHGVAGLIVGFLHAELHLQAAQLIFLNAERRPVADGEVVVFWLGCAVPEKSFKLLVGAGLLPQGPGLDGVGVAGMPLLSETELCIGSTETVGVYLDAVGLLFAVVNKLQQ